MLQSFFALRQAYPFGWPKVGGLCDFHIDYAGKWYPLSAMQYSRVMRPGLVPDTGEAGPVRSVYFA